MSKNEDKSFQELQDDYYSNNEDGYIGAQYSNILESTKELERNISETIVLKKDLSFLDAGCGDGSIIWYLQKSFPDAKFTGFDISKGMVSFARKRLPLAVSIERGDLLDMEEFSKEKFDIVYSIHTLSLFSNFEPVLLELIKSTKKHLFINSLFSDQNIDTLTTVKEPGFPEIQWNIFSMDKIEDFLVNNGASSVQFKRLHMPFDLEKPEEGMGSYTRKLSSGDRLTFSGPLYLPWYILRADFN